MNTDKRLVGKVLDGYVLGDHSDAAATRQLVALGVDESLCPALLSSTKKLRRVSEHEKRNGEKVRRVVSAVADRS